VHTRLVVGEEHLAAELASAAHARIVENALQVLLDSLRQDPRRAAISAVGLPCSTNRVTSCSRSVRPVAAGLAGPLHVHHREDEGFWLLEGDATFEVGSTTIEAHAGDYVFGPRDIPHRYTVGSAGCRMLFIFTPGDFEEMLVATSEPAGSRTLPPPSQEESDLARIAAIVRAYGNELLG